MVGGAAPRPQYSLSIQGLFEASLTVLVTTLEDCVWLIPFVAHASMAGSTRVAWIHSFIFVGTFTACSTFACLLAYVLDRAIVGTMSGSEVVLETVGATLCWIFAAFFFYQSYRKRLNRRTAGTLQDDGSPPFSTDPNAPEALVLRDEEHPSYGTTDAPSLANPNGPSDLYAPDTTTVLHQHRNAQPWMIVSLTIIGSLDEISYFPAVIVGQIFTSAELIAGTIIASFLILVLVDVLQRRCRCCLETLDRIPLYAIIGLFAVLLSVQAIIGALQD
jgi:hypothetical protein